MNTEKIKILFLRALALALKALSFIPKPILAVFAPAIRHALLKFMKHFSQPDDPRPAMAAAEHLIDKLMPNVYRFFCDEKFRQAAGFEKLDQKEHDRIFNELEVAALCICLFCLEHRDVIVGQDYFHFWKNVHEQVPLQMEQKLLGLGVGKEDAGLVKKLIQMRHDEYEKIGMDSREYFDEQEDFKKYGNISKDMMTRVQATAVGTADHILRGKLKVGDEILRILRQWLFPLDLEIIRFIKKL